MALPSMQVTYYDFTGFSNLKTINTSTFTNNTNTDLYSIIYSADPAYFNKSLPLINEMLKSLKID